ncbi:TetR/AcrR family transcriptional regulator [Humibacter ginsenosidimutans]|uniref:TetR/AcrR family transcriptional regulator n=1 Tax=Humibacter ginsenosidimutans TaxID=2599293 RepID=A0A5B8M4U0_9MICO|nr:TetR/AcrR family transcriptional regulator [Humibacter ginsenosidimutans]QDZ15607.1 TetR/AcrR family transcriptional regulator [Humibacter ginsenosidimutans]
MSRPSSYDDALRDRLLAATAEAVAADGPDRISLREVARTAGTSTSAVYSLFGGKGELLAAVIAHGFASFSRAQHEAEHGGLRALGIAYRSWAQQNPALYRLMFGGALTAYESEGPNDALEPLMRAVAARGASDPLAAAITVWAHVHGAVSLEFACVAPPDVDQDAAYDNVLDAIERLWPEPRDHEPRERETGPARRD